MKTSKFQYMRKSGEVIEQKAEATIMQEAFETITETQIMEYDPFQKESKSLEHVGMLVSGIEIQEPHFF